MPKVAKISLYIFTMSPENHGNEVDILPADKQKSFLQVNSITLGEKSQTSWMYSKQQVYNIFAISQGKRERLSLLFGYW